MSPEEFDMACSRATSLFSYGDEFEDARSDAWDIACSLVEDGCKIGVDRSQVVLFRQKCYELHLLVSEADKDISARIAKGEQILHAEADRILETAPTTVLLEVPKIVRYMDRLHALRSWLRRPASLWEIDGDPPVFRRIQLTDPREMKISQTTGVKA